MNDQASARSRIAVLCLVLAVVIGVGVGGAYLVGVDLQNTAADSAAPTETPGSEAEPTTQDPPAETGGSDGAGPSEPAVVDTVVPESDVPEVIPVAADVAGEGVAATGPTDAALVQVSEVAAADPNAAAIADLLTRHFTSINQGKYENYAATVTSPLSEDDFRQLYSSTLDSDGLIHLITVTDSGQTQIQLSFISQQSAELAPPDLPSNCIRWVVHWNIDSTSGELLIGSSDPTKTQKEQCASS